MTTLSSLRRSRLNPRLRALVNTGASQINGCACWVEMHTKDARVNGEIQQRLCTLSVWREGDQGDETCVRSQALSPTSVAGRPASIPTARINVGTDTAAAVVMPTIAL